MRKPAVYLRSCICTRGSQHFSGSNDNTLLSWQQFNVVHMATLFVPHATGGPVFNQAGECVGIAFQSLASGDAENIGYVIPTPVIDHFLTDYQRNGAFTGFPAMSVRWQSMESQPLRCLTIRFVTPCRSLHVRSPGMCLERHLPPCGKLLVDGEPLVSCPNAKDQQICIHCVL